MGESTYQNYPWRETSNHFHALTAEIFLQRTKVKQVLPVYRNFCKVYKKPQDVLNDQKKKYVKILGSLGLRWRIPLFYKLCEEVVENYGALIPVNKAELLKLSGVGDYVASAFLSFHLNNPYPLIDANTVRFVSRYFGINRNPESRRDKKFIQIINELLPNRYLNRFNYCFLDFSMSICSNTPACLDCKLRRKCKFYRGKVHGH